MRLLVVAQVVDIEHPVLGFFHTWIRELARKFEHIEVICLQKGTVRLPSNVRVHSLGKERGVRNPLVYAARFGALLWRLRGDYDTVFVHMNQEYILLAGWHWLLTKKPAYLWRNHYQGSFLTDIAARFCRKVFCTSRYSYTAKYKQTVIMPIGVDTEAFKKRGTAHSSTILSLGRIAPSKKNDVLVDALAHLSVDFSCDMYGDALPKDVPYRESLKARAKELPIEFHSGVPNSETPTLYSTHEIFVNLSASGMYDKTIIEAAACEALVLASSKDFAAEVSPQLVFKEGDAEDLARKLEALLALSAGEKQVLSITLRTFAEKHSLAHLIERLTQEMR